MEEKLEYFELNNKILEDFDNLMKLHLDQVKYLKIDKNITNSKFFNIIGLCFNINTLEISAEQKLDLNKIFSSICKPGLLENIKLENVKLPTGKFLKKFNNIKKIEMKKIKFSEVKQFYLDLDCQKTVEEIYMEDVDFSRENFDFFINFENLKKFISINITNLKNEKFNFLPEAKKIEEIKIKGNKIKIDDLNNIVLGNYKKDIELKLEDIDNCIIIKDKKVNIKIDAKNIEKLINNISFYKITNLDVIFNDEVNFEHFTKILKKVKKEINIGITDISKLTVNQSIILKERLKVKNISLLNKQKEIITIYDIDSFIDMRQAIDKFIENVPEELKEDEKFLWIYKILLKNIKYDEKEEQDLDDLKKGLIEKCCISKGYSEILKNCLLCLGFEINSINGKLKKENIEWNWLQVKINENWYNADIALDAKQNKKMKYCLINNEKISKTHEIETNSMYCIEEYDYKEILKFWKNENINKEEKKSILKGIIEKLKVLFVINKRLPEGKSEVIENDRARAEK